VSLLAQQLCQRVIFILGSNFSKDHLQEKPFKIGELQTTYYSNQLVRKLLYVKQKMMDSWVGASSSYYWKMWPNSSSTLFNNFGYV